MRTGYRSLSQGSHLRFAAGDERLCRHGRGPAPHRQQGEYDVIIPQLCQLRYGGSHRVYEAAVKAVEAVDACVGQLVDHL